MTAIASPSTAASWRQKLEARYPGERKHTPARSNSLNDADHIQRQLQEDGHRVWGFVIYRCTYGNDDDFNKCIEQLRRYSLRRPLKWRNGVDLLPSFKWTIIQDQALLEDANVATVRTLFEQWCETAVEKEQGTPTAGDSVRYQYCIMIDDEVIDTVVYQNGPIPEYDTVNRTVGYVKLVKRRWSQDSDGPPANSLDEPKEHSDVADKGWMMAAFRDVFVPVYVRLRGAGRWGEMYQSPPRVCRGL